MSYVPFLRPSLVGVDEIIGYLRSIDESHIYSNFGPLNTRFEARVLQEHFDGRGASATVQNATIGLMLAIDSVRRPGGRYAIMPSFTFAATPQAALWCGLEPYFVDIRDGDLCADERLVAEALAELGDQVAVVVPYAAFGTVCDLEYYADLHAAGIPVVVDAAASFGARSRQEQFGTGFPGVVVFSFHATKSFGIGEGGLVYSGDSALIERVRRASNFGFSAARESESRGLNGKLSEYAAAVALATLDRFEAKMRLRQAVYDTYVHAMRRRGLLDRGWRLQQTAGRVPHQFMSVLCPDRLDNVQLVALLEQRGIQTRTYFSPACHQQPAFAGYRAGSLPVTTSVACRILNLPLWEDFPLGEVERVVEAVAAL